MDGHTIQAFAPRGGDGGLLAFDPRGRRLSVEVQSHPRSRQRDDEAHGHAGVRRERELIAKRSGRVSSLIVHLGGAGPGARGQQPGNGAGIERERPDAVRRSEREDLAVGVDGESRAIPLDVTDRADAADRVQRLRGRIDLERTRGQDELERQGMAAEVPHLVARDEPGLIA